MAGKLERQPGFVNFLTKKDQFGFFYFVMIDILERIEIHAVAPFGKMLQMYRIFLAAISNFFITARLCIPQTNERKTQNAWLRVISMGLGAWVCAQWQGTQMKHTCVALAMSASASGWTYSESRSSYLNQNSTSDTKRRANLNLGFEAGRNQYGLRYIQRNSENNPSSQEANITFGSNLADKLFVEGMVLAEKRLHL
jgi:hypothetical protein